MRIGELLIHQGLITPQQLDAALKAQTIFGGRLGTNLVEHGFVDEQDLARILAGQLGIPTVAPERLASVPAEVLSLVPADLARRHGVVPFHHDEERDRVSVAMADPNNLQRIDEIQFALGRSVSFHVAPEVVLAWALERYYGVERKRRFIRLGGVTAAEMQVDPRRDGVRARSAVKPAAAPEASSRAAQAATGRRSFGDEALARILEAPGKRELVEAITDCFARCSDQVLFLAARGGELLAWEARGLPVATEALRRVAVPISSSPLLARILEEMRPRRIAAVEDPELRNALEDSLFVDCGHPLFVLPLVVNHQPFGLFLLARHEQDQVDDLTPVLCELLKRVACKLQVFYLQEYLAAPLPKARTSEDVREPVGTSS